MRKMRVLFYADAKTPPVVREIDGTLEAMQALIGGGFLQAVRIRCESCSVYCDEDGQMKKLPPNRRIPSGQIIVGPFFVVGWSASGEEERGLLDDEIARLKRAIP